MVVRQHAWTCVAFATVFMTMVGCDAVDQPVASPRAVAVAPERGRVIGGEAVARTPVWPRSVDHGALATLSDASLDAVAQAPAPVLIPAANHPLAGGVVTAGQAFWAYSASLGGVTVAIHASSQARLYPRVDPDAATAVAGDRLRGLPARVERAEGIWAASWIENGVAYALEVECADVDDPACRDDAYIRGMAETLTHVGGRGGAR